MRKRIISGVILGAAAIIIMALHSHFSYLTVAVCALFAGVACYELLKNTGAVKTTPVVVLAIIITAVGTVIQCCFGQYATLLWVTYVLLIAVLSLAYHKDMSHLAILSGVAAPIILSYGFFSVYALLDASVFYILLVLNFSALCDCGAYFVGVFFGRHKLCPGISPKKTVEGSVGGLLTSLAGTVLFSLAFGKAEEMVVLLIATPVFCVIGMVGDLFASVIKRSANIKDYGNIIPGHGGVLDRFDSILLIAPVFAQFLKLVGVM